MKEPLLSPSPMDHAALLCDLEALCAKFPGLEFDYLGESILGRPIPRIRLGHGPKMFFYIGAHHGMEWITASLLQHFLRDFLEIDNHRGRIFGQDLALWKQRNTLFLIPMLNPDGVEYQIHGIHGENPLYERLMEMNRQSNDFSTWQSNARGVDLNHNYDADFWEYKKQEAELGIQNGPTRFSGEHPESEPEVHALCNCIRYHSPTAILTLHTQGEEIFFKSGHRTLPGTTSVARALSRLTGYRLSVAEGLASYGGLTDWCVQKEICPSFTMECGKGTNPLPAAMEFPIYAKLRRALFLFPTLF
ncbi:MAG: hypothetical protein IJX28_09380 [Clostridia bacterium]|nr:hypothetical protein [Clostridia bacterium]